MNTQLDIIKTQHETIKSQAETISNLTEKVKDLLIENERVNKAYSELMWCMDGLRK